MEFNNQQKQRPPPPPPPPPPALRSSSPSSFTIFGDYDPLQQQQQLPPVGNFASIFPSPVAGNSICMRCTQPMQFESLDSQMWSTVHGNSAENVARIVEDANIDVTNLERRSIFQERIEPCPLSSSIYYGSQEDMYILSSSDLTSKSYAKFYIKEDSKDDPNHLQSATRGNWWQGNSLRLGSGLRFI